ncbi:MAG: O-antigen ligase family protein [Desulfosarcina sp.]|nr:O-antigen ligase family protein [Desulfobacterales bacterium]
MSYFKKALDALCELKQEKTGRLLFYINFFALSGLALIIISIPFNHVNAVQSIGFILFLLTWILKRTITKDWVFKTTTLYLSICILLAVILLSLVTCYDLHYTLKRIKSEIITLILLFLFVTDYCNAHHKTYSVFLIFLIGNFLALAIFLFQFYSHGFNINNFITSVATKEFMSRGLPHTSAYFLFASTFLYTALYYIKQLKYYLLLIPYFLLNIFFLFLANQRAALVGFVCVVIAHFLLFAEHRKKAFVFILLIGCLSTMFILSTPLKSILIHEDWSKIKKFDLSTDSKKDTFQARIKIQKYFWAYLKDNPFKGVGYGRRNLRKVENEITYEQPDYTHAHNVFFNFTLQTGVQGLLALLYVIFIQFKLFWNGFKKSKKNFDRFFFSGTILYMIGIWTRMQFDDVFRHGTAINYWIIIGMANSFWLIINQEKTDTVNE